MILHCCSEKNKKPKNQSAITFTNRQQHVGQMKYRKSHNPPPIHFITLNHS